MERRIQADKAFLKWSEKTSKNVVHIADAWYAAVEWADEHPNLYSVTRKAVERERKHLIDKVCEWLEQRQLIDLEVPNIEKFINDFRKDMEEQQ